ncbi:hypothetical protein AAK967_05730 [Atopobiaceae bacterium 24-176]
MSNSLPLSRRAFLAGEVMISGGGFIYIIPSNGVRSVYSRQVSTQVYSYAFRYIRA